MKITLYVAKYCPYSLRAKIALAEKRMNFDIVEINELEQQKVKQISPQGVFPVLEEKNYTLNNKKALIYYIDERFPAPALLPNSAQDKIRIRLAIEKLEKEYYPILKEVREERGNNKKLNSIFKGLNDKFKLLNNLFKEGEYFLYPSFTLVDCYIAALILYLEAEGFTLDESLTNMYSYRELLLSRDSIKKVYFRNKVNQSLLKTLRANK